MVALRRHGISLKEIGRRLGFSERTVRRYVGNIDPELHLPEANDEPEFDARDLRARLLKKFVGDLFRDESLRRLTLTWKQVSRSYREAIYGGPVSTRFLREAERLLRDTLQDTGTETLRLIGRDPSTQQRFVRDVTGDLRTDYERWLYVKQNLFSDDSETGEDWRPPRERPAHETREVDKLWRHHEDSGA